MYSVSEILNGGAFEGLGCILCNLGGWIETLPLMFRA